MIEIYTDGSWSIPRHIGGFSVVIIKDGKYSEHFVEELKNSTSNRAEMLALIKALQISANETEVTIYSDSRYVVNGYVKWAEEWKRSGWKTSKGKDTKNADLWRKIFALKKEHIIVKWVRGHSGVFGNELADSLAKF